MYQILLSFHRLFSFFDITEMLSCVFDPCRKTLDVICSFARLSALLNRTALSNKTLHFAKNRSSKFLSFTNLNMPISNYEAILRGRKRLLRLLVGILVTVSVITLMSSGLVLLDSAFGTDNHFDRLRLSELVPQGKEDGTRPVSELRWNEEEQVLRNWTWGFTHHHSLTNNLALLSQVRLIFQALQIMV